MAATSNRRDIEGTVPSSGVCPAGCSPWFGAELRGWELLRLGCLRIQLELLSPRPALSPLSCSLGCSASPLDEKSFLIHRLQEQHREMKAAKIPPAGRSGDLSVLSREAGAPSMPWCCPGHAHRVPRNSLCLLPGPAMRDRAGSMPFPDLEPLESRLEPGFPPAPDTDSAAGGGWALRQIFHLHFNFDKIALFCVLLQCRGNKTSFSPREPLPAGEGFPVGIREEVTSCSIPNLHPKAAPSQICSTGRSHRCSPRCEGT